MNEQLEGVTPQGSTMKEKEVYCKRCGKCCEAIAINNPPSRFEGSKFNGLYANDVGFIAENWTNISENEALSINSHLSNWIIKSRQYGTRLYFYTCKQYDKETHLCKMHDKKCHVCAEYPWYECGVQTSMVFYTPDCGYTKEVEDYKLSECTGMDMKVTL